MATHGHPGHLERRISHPEEAHLEFEYLGVDWPASLTGWAIAFLVGIILSAVAVAVLGAIGLPTSIANVSQLVSASTVGSFGILSAFVIALVSYFVGGYIAGRMAGYAGILHGIMVLAVGFVITLFILLAAAIFGNSFALLTGLNITTRLSFAGVAKLASLGGLIILVIEGLGAAIGGWLGERHETMMKP